jgi:hypothetical protein
MIPIEVFAAKDEAGALLGVMLTAPSNSGLRQADTLRVVGLRVVAIRQRSILSIDLPSLDDESLGYLREAARRGGRVAIAEFTPLGLADSYMLNVDAGTLGKPTAADGGAGR